MLSLLYRCFVGIYEVDMDSFSVSFGVFPILNKCFVAFWPFFGTYKSDMGSFSVCSGMFPFFLHKCCCCFLAVLLGLTKMVWIPSLCALGCSFFLK